MVDALEVLNLTYNFILMLGLLALGFYVCKRLFDRVDTAKKANIKAEIKDKGSLDVAIDDTTIGQ